MTGPCTDSTDEEHGCNENQGGRVVLASAGCNDSTDDDFGCWENGRRVRASAEPCTDQTDEYQCWENRGYDLRGFAGDLTNAVLAGMP